MDKPLPEPEKIVLAFIRSHSGLTRTDIALELNMTVERVQTALSTLLDKGLITFTQDYPMRYFPR